MARARDRRGQRFDHQDLRMPKTEADRNRTDSIKFFLRASEYERAGEIGQGINNLCMISLILSDGMVWKGL